MGVPDYHRLTQICGATCRLALAEPAGVEVGEFDHPDPVPFWRVHAPPHTWRRWRAGRRRQPRNTHDQACDRGRRGKGGRPWPSAAGSAESCSGRSIAGITVAHLGASSAPAGTSRTATPRGTSLRSTCRAPLVHGGAVRVAGAHVPRDDAPDPRDRRGEAARAGRLAAEQASSVTMAEASSKPLRCRRSRASCRRSGSSRPSSGARSARRSPSCCPRSSTSASWHPCKRSRWTVVRGRFELMIDQFSCCRLVLLYKFKLHDISPHSFCFRAQKYV
jgi:hypothetical protein